MGPRALAVAAVLTAGLASAAFGAGFGIFEHGTKAMGMAGAFTAQADDGSAMFHNVGGLAFVDEQEFLAGITWINSSEADFDGLGPFPGTGITDKQDSLSVIVPHFYWTRPVNEKVKLGLGFFAPFGLETSWNADTFVGRFVSVNGELQAVDLTPTVAFKLSDRVGVGLSAVIRASSVRLVRRQPAINPFTSQPTDIAAIDLESDTDTGFGWQGGLLVKASDRVSFGLSYRSKVEIDYGGDANFTQILTGFPQFDGAVSTALPFGRALPIATTVDFPDMASVGVAFDVTENLLVEVDANYAGWSSVDQIVIDFRGALPNQVLRQNWDDSNNYRLGVRWTLGPKVQWRFGWVFDETPQPDENVGPLLSDSDRNGYTVGYGRTGNRFRYDVALMYLPFDERTTRVNQDNFNGTYNFTGWLLGFSVGW